jgi:tetratricopeptide (TPR) repeat protein
VFCKRGLIPPLCNSALDGTWSIGGNLLVCHILEVGTALVWHRFVANLCAVHMGGIGLEDQTSPLATKASVQSMSRNPASLLAVVLLHQLALTQQGPSPSTEARFQSIIQQIEQLLPTLDDRSAGAFALARLYAQVGDAQKALKMLKQSLAADEGFDPGGSEMLSPLRIAIAQCEGPERGIEEIAAIGDQQRLRGYPFLHAALGEFDL